MEVTLEEVELLANLLTRAGVNPYEAQWANNVMNKMRAIAAGAALSSKQPKEPTPVEPDREPPPQGGSEEPIS